MLRKIAIQTRLPGVRLAAIAPRRSGASFCVLSPPLADSRICGDSLLVAAHPTGMQNKSYLVRRRGEAIQHVRAATVEMRGEHLAFLTADGNLAAMFLFSVVESWNETDDGPSQ